MDGCRGDACGVWLCAPDPHDSEPRAHLARVRLACELAEAASGTPGSPFMVKRGSCVARYALAEGLEDDGAARAAAAEARAAAAAEVLDTGPGRVLAGAKMAPTVAGASMAPTVSGASMAPTETRRRAPPPEGVHTAPAALQAPAERLAGAQQAPAEPGRAEDLQGWRWWRTTVGIDGTVRPRPPRTKWTRRVPHPVLIGHTASLTPY